MGCNAGGVAWECRFCGFGPFVKCPGPPKSIVVLTSILAGSVETFDAHSFRSGLRSVLGLGSEVEIALNVTAASVRVEAGIVLRGTEDAAATSTALAAMDAATLSQALGATVTAIEQVSAPLTFEFPDEPPAVSPLAASVRIEAGGAIIIKPGGRLKVG